METINEKHKDVKFMVWLGDNIADMYYLSNIEFQKETLKQITNKLLLNYNKIGDIYPVIGNHDVFPRDHMILDAENPDWALEFLAEIWAPWLIPSCIFQVLCKYYKKRLKVLENVGDIHKFIRVQI